MRQDKISLNCSQLITLETLIRERAEAGINAVDDFAGTNGLFECSARCRKPLAGNWAPARINGPGGGSASVVIE
jgi:hypothetical protein